MEIDMSTLTHRLPTIIPLLIATSLVAIRGTETAAQAIHRQRVSITSGANVHVSKARSDLPHYESLAAGDPSNPGRMISCIHVYPRSGPVGFEQQCYTTFDGGKTWAATLRV